jgi:hypothetical protein
VTIATRDDRVAAEAGTVPRARALDAAVSGPRGPGSAGRCLRAGRVRGWLRGDVHLAELAPPDGDPDRLLGAPDCRLIKDQRKVTVGVVRAPGGAATYIKRYNVFSWRVRLGSLFRRSPALRALEGTFVLTGAGFLAAEPVAALEYRRWGLVERSFLLTTEVGGAVPADTFWWSLRGRPAGERRAFVGRLARLFAALHRAGVYHGDLKDANLLIRREDERLDCYLLDLERLRRRRRVARRRRIKNLVQLHRTLGRLATARENLLFLRVYLGDDARNAALRRAWRRRVCAAARRKDLRHALRGLT